MTFNLLIDASLELSIFFGKFVYLSQQKKKKGICMLISNYLIVRIGP